TSRAIQAAGSPPEEARLSGSHTWFSVPSMAFPGLKRPEEAPAMATAAWEVETASSSAAAPVAMASDFTDIKTSWLNRFNKKKVPTQPPEKQPRAGGATLHERAILP